MAFKAKLTNIQRTDQTMNVEVEYSDDSTGFSMKRVFNFQDAATLTQAEIVTQVRLVGQQYKDAQAKESTLKSAIGLEIVI